MITTPQLDDFERTPDEDPLFFGGNWNPNAPRLVYEHELRLHSASGEAIARNQGGGAAPNGRGSYWDHVQKAGDCEVWGLCGLGSAGNSELGIGLLLHLQDPATAGVDGYQAHSANGVNSVNFVLARITNDVATTLDQTGGINDSLNEPRVGDRLLFRRRGSDLEFWHERGADNWILRCSATDTTYDGGYIGLMIVSDDITYDGFGGGVERQARLQQIIRYR